MKSFAVHGPLGGEKGSLFVGARRDTAVIRSRAVERRDRARCSRRVMCRQVNFWGVAMTMNEYEYVYQRCSASIARAITR